MTTRLNLNELDDAIVVDTCAGFAGGQHSAATPDRLAAREAALLQNMELRDGTAATRRGTERLGAAIPGTVQGLGWYETPAASYAVASTAGALWQWDGHTWSAFSGYAAVNPAGTVCLAQLADRLYVAEGSTPLHVWDGAALTNLGTGAPEQPPVGEVLLAAQNRLWLAGVAAMPDGLFVSKALEGSAWDMASGSLRIGAGEGDPITGLAELDDYQIAVFKRNSIYVVRADPATTGGGVGSPLSKATVTKVSETVGCVSHRSIARVGSELWFLAETGIYSLGRVTAQTVREVKAAVSSPVQDVLERVNWTAAAKRAAAVTWGGKYLLSLPLDRDALPATVLVYQAGTPAAWAGVWTGWKAQCWAVAREGGRERLLLGRDDGQVWRWLDDVAVANEVETTYQDAGAEIASTLVTRAMDFGEAVCPKSALNVEAEFFDSQATAALALCLDEEQPITLGNDIPTAQGRLLLNFALPATLPGQGLKRRAFGAQHLPPFRSMQVSVSSAAGKLVVRGVTASAFVNTVRVEE